MWLERALSILKGDLLESLGYSSHDWSIIASWTLAGVLKHLAACVAGLNVFPA
jgi:hypothetical protein